MRIFKHWLANLFNLLHTRERSNSKNNELRERFNTSLWTDQLFRNLPTINSNKIIGKRITLEPTTTYSACEKCTWHFVRSYSCRQNAANYYRITPYNYMDTIKTLHNPNLTLIILSRYEVECWKYRAIVLLESVTLYSLLWTVKTRSSFLVIQTVECALSYCSQVNYVVCFQESPGAINQKRKYQFPFLI